MTTGRPSLRGWRARRGLRRIRGLALGQQGWRPALALAAVALLTVFVAVAGPRELAAVQDRALQSELGSLPGLDTGVASTGEWQVAPGAANAMTLGDSEAVLASIGAAAQKVVAAPPSQWWARVSTPAQQVTNPARQAVLSGAPAMQVAYQSGLGANARLVAGRLPDSMTAAGPGASQPGGAAGQPGAEDFAAAVTTATAARYGLHVGSVVDLFIYLTGSAAVRLRITAIVRPLRPQSAFWQSDPALAAPLIPNPGQLETWTAGAFVGPAELAPLQAAFAGATLQGEWFFPLDLTGVTQVTLPRVLSGLTALEVSAAGQNSGAAALTSTGMSLNVSSDLGTAVSGFLAQQQAADGIDTLLIADIFIADLLLMFLCARLAADAHWPELALMRARGASTGQLAALMLGRAACVTGPAVIAAAAAASATGAPAGAASWQLGGAAALAAVAFPAVIAAWAHRRWQPAATGRADLTAVRPSRRRLVAELTVLVVTAAALLDLRLRGVAAAADSYTRVVPVLVAAAAGLIATRLYPLPLRSLLPIAAARPGPVSFLGLARAGRSRLSTVLPALALVITLTLAAFGTIVISSISRAQAAASWQQVGADVTIQASGNGVVTPAAERAVGAVPGVSRAAAVYTAASGGPFAGTLLPSGGGPVSVGLVVADPAQYAALARQTPWPRFPAGALTHGSGSSVPVLMSAELARQVFPAPAGGQAARRGQQTGLLVVDGNRLTVSLAGTAGSTPAMPGGGIFVVLPAWAYPRFPAVAGPDILLATGPAIDLAAIRAAVSHTMPGALITSRAQVLSSLMRSPAPLAAVQLCQLGIWVTALLAVVAMLFSLSLSAGGRVQLLERLSALGMASRQARALAFGELLPLLSVAVLGTVIAGFVLAAVVGPVLNLSVFAGSAITIAVRPDPVMLLPAAGIVVLAIVIVALESAALLRRDIAAALRREEAG